MSACSLASCVGLSLWVLLALQILVGILLGTQYSVSASTAHASVAELRSSALWGTLAGFHYWASAITIVVAWANVAILLWSGGHRWSERWAWWGAIGGLVLALIFQMTGNLLPLSAHDARTAYVEAQIASGTPLLGQFMMGLALGGDAVSEITLGRWAFAHRIVAPLLTLLLAIFALRGLGQRPKWAAAFPLVGIASALVLSLSHGAPFGPPASIADFQSSAANPMWYVLPIHSLHMMFANWNPDLAWVGAILVPLLVLGFALLAPLLSRGAGDGGSAFGRLALLALISFFILSGISYGTNVQNLTAEHVEPAPVVKQDKPMDVVDLVLAERGRELFRVQRCGDCHRIGTEAGGTMGPNLAGAGLRYPDRSWLAEMIKDPKSKGFTRMKPFPKLPADDLAALAEYVRSLK